MSEAGVTIGAIPVSDGDIGGERFATLSVIDAGALQDRPEQRLT